MSVLLLLLVLILLLRSYGGVSAGVTAGSSGTMEKAQSVVDEIIAAGGEAIPDVSLHSITSTACACVLWVYFERLHCDFYRRAVPLLNLKM